MSDKNTPQQGQQAKAPASTSPSKPAPAPYAPKMVKVRANGIDVKYGGKLYAAGETFAASLVALKDEIRDGIVKVCGKGDKK